MAPLKMLCFALLVHFLLASSSSSSSFTPVDNYLINCGSVHNVTLHNRLFLADTDHSSFRLTDPTNTSSLALYRTARLFSSAASSYTFQIRTTGYHFLRMHFHPFKALNFDLHSANFSVYVNGNLTFSSTNSTSVVVVKEFILFLTPVEIGQKNIILDVRFVPASKLDFAYVNAIEVFSAPDDLILENGAKSVGPVGVDDYIGLSSKILETLHRVNVGGSTLTPFNDTLWRTWVNDEDFLVLPSAAKRVATTHIPNYQGDGASREVAPDHVYMTAQEMNRDNLTDARFNISWEFPVGSSAGQEHLVRLHFCDIVSASLNQLYFNVYINGYLGYKDLDLSALTIHMLASPYYLDFVSQSDDKGAAVRISVGPSDLSSTLTVNAILNGVEVMKLINPVSLPPKTDRKDVWILLGSVLGGFGALTVVLVLVMGLKCLKRKQKPRRTESIGWTNMRVYGGSTTHKSIKSILASPGPDGYVAMKIPFVDIQTATNKFDTKLIIGSGGFGTVFKGVLGDNTKVAVKRGVQGSRQGRPEFQSEIAILSKIRHRHLVSLIGYCEEQSEMILVYEYMENGPLKKHLYGADCGHLSWKQRLEICIGAARGLHYLHTGSAQGIIHRDVKSTNILLDGNYVAKVGDFGLSRSGPCVDETHVSTIVKGSFGYLDPEYFRRQQLTDKSDVYSFGVLLLEVVCARPAVDPLLAREQVNLAEWAMLWLKKDLLEQIIDPHLAGQIKPSSLKKFGETAEKCLADYGVDRPTMGDVLWNLECALQLQEAETRNQQERETSIPGSGSEAPPAIDEVQQENEENGSLEISTRKVFSQLMNNNGR
ncbi:unnamed protein product [Rhodiola kirilowii]